MILKFADFWKTHKPKLMASELHLFSDELQVAGTMDLVVELNDKLWLLDIKTSNSLHDTHDLQLACYQQMWNESFDQKINNAGILWLKASTRGADKSGKKIQGEGWQLKEMNGTSESNIKTFKNLFEIFKFKVSYNDADTINESNQVVNCGLVVETKAYGYVLVDFGTGVI